MRTGCAAADSCGVPPVSRALASGVAASALAAALLAAAPAAGRAAVEVGVYQDDPARGLPSLTRAVGAPKALSVYVTGGQALDPAVVRLARTRRMRLVVSWMPDLGRTGRGPARVGIRGVNSGRYDAPLRALVIQLRGLRPNAVLRPMPEMNTPWYAWSGTARGNSAASYVRAWNRVRRVVRQTGRGRVRMLWAPYARSIPDTPANAVTAYFPGADRVDLVGASAYNFGDRGGLAWTTPRALFADAYRRIRGVAPDTPFWIAETGTTSRGGDAAAWVRDLATLPAAFPGTAGIVWYDVKEPNGDFRILAQRTRAAAFRSVMRGLR